MVNLLDTTWVQCRLIDALRNHTDGANGFVQRSGMEVALLLLADLLLDEVVSGIWKASSILSNWSGGTVVYVWFGLRHLLPKRPDSSGIRREPHYKSQAMLCRHDKSRLLVPRQDPRHSSRPRRK